MYGVTGELSPGTTPVESNVRNLQTDNHVFAKVALGGESRWTIFGGVDANQRNFSADTFKANEEQQWSTNVGTRYATSPDLSFGVTGAYVSGRYPHGTPADPPITTSDSAVNFSTRSVSATTRWQASGNSVLDASVGYTTESNDAFSSATVLRQRFPQLGLDAAVSLHGELRPQAQFGCGHVDHRRQYRGRQRQQPERHLHQQRGPFRGGVRADGQDQPRCQRGLLATQVFQGSTDSLGNVPRPAPARAPRGST